MSIIGKFPSVKGILRENADVGKKSFFGVGGVAEILFIPEDINDLILFLKNMPEDLPITVLGAMSNVLIRSGGISGVVIMLGGFFNRIFVEENVLEVGAAVGCGKLSSVAMNYDLGGFEFLMGIPGTIGGAIRMNAGCYGSSIGDILMEFEGVNFSGQIKWIKSADVEFKYRNSGISDDLIITRAWLRSTKEANYSIPRKTDDVVAKRRSSQPLNQRSCGSAFKNPEGKKAWELIDAAGCRGMKLGGAVISQKHCNFIVNEGSATPDDIENLGELVIQKVFENSGIRLEWEIIRLGEKNKVGE
ncbi:MAG: UDP-N-acetylmuramate dehydrogenase [Holosporaceae bacterium]|jgi:UDP-N-acetylmuramate dehydrogenase|nr:UDP-N-acetylmuramate dehydrogenase [Holosporaceae bacterium]